MKLSAQFKAQCEGKTTKYRAELDLKAFDALPGRLLAQHLRVDVVTPFQLAELYGLSSELVEHMCASNSWSAMLIGEEYPLIVTHPQSAAVRIESSTMHELAHHILRHKPLEWDSIGMPLRDRENEREAEYLGSCLQIPRRGLLWAVQQRLTLAETAKHFGASQEMVGFRCNMTGVVLMD